MKTRTSFLTRCLSLVMALLMLCTSSNLGLVLQAFAAESVTVTDGELIASNYAGELSEAELALFAANLLKGGSVTYTEPTKDLVQVDTDAGTVTFGAHGEWTVASAKVVPAEGAEQDLTISGNTAKYDKAQATDVFSVEATYRLSKTVDVQTPLQAIKDIKNGLPTLEMVKAQENRLATFETAMPQLVTIATNGLADGMITLDEDKAKIILAFNDEMTANGGHLKLSTMIAQYDSMAKTEYLLKNGDAMRAEVQSMTDQLSGLASVLTAWPQMIDLAVNWGKITAEDAPLYKNAINSLINLYNGLLDALKADWTAAKAGTSLVNGEINYSDLDAKIAAIESVSSAADKEVLVKEVTVRADLNMADVDVVIELYAVVNNELKKTGEKTATTKALSVGADKAAMLAAIEATGIEAAAKAEWAEAGVDFAHYDVTATELPGTLSENGATYTVTYMPKEYTISYSEAWEGAPAEAYYGYVLTLPTHSNEAQSYDYTVVTEGGETLSYMQGEKHTVVGNTTVSRSEGKAYDTQKLYAIIAGNYGDEAIKNIMTTGALKGDETVAYRKPGAEDKISDLMKIENGMLTVTPYASNYKGLSWTAYKYGETSANKEFSGNSVSWDKESAHANYILRLSNFDTAYVEAKLAAVKTMVENGNSSKKNMDQLKGQLGTISQLNKTLVSALSGMVADDSTMDPTIRSEITASLEELKNHNWANGRTDADMLIVEYLNKYNTDGMVYYYRNSKTIIDEVDFLIKIINDLLSDPNKVAALKGIIPANMAQYADKLDDVAAISDTIKGFRAGLYETDALIDTGDKLPALVAAMDGVATVSYTTGVPYIVSSDFLVSGKPYVEIIVNIDGKEAGRVQSLPVDENDVLSSGDIAGLKSGINALLEKNLKSETLNKVPHYKPAEDLSDLNKLEGAHLTATVTYTFNYEPIKYTVIVAGETNEITINNPIVNLPASSDPAVSYKYFWGEKELTGSTYTFASGDLKEGVTITITRTASDIASDNFEEDVAEVNAAIGTLGTLVHDKDKNTLTYTGEVNGMMGLIQGIYTKMDYKVITMDGETFIFEDEVAKKIYLQGLLNAIMRDLSSESLIAMGNNNGGTLMTTTMKFGDNLEKVLTINLTSVPGALKSLANMLNARKHNITFSGSDSAAMQLNLNLPKAIYDLYLTALIGTNNRTLDNITDQEQKIAADFLYKYIQMMYGKDADGKPYFANVSYQTFANTFSMAGVNVNLESYKDQINQITKIMSNATFSVDDNGKVDVELDAANTVNLLSTTLGMGDLGSLTSLFAEVSNKTSIKLSATTTLTNSTANYKALVLDVGGNGITNKHFYAASNDGSLDISLGGTAGVILVSNVGDLSIKTAGTTILDLNGMSVDKISQSGTGTLHIIDSAFDSGAAKVTGDVYGSSIKITGGNYTADVSAYLASDYVKDTDGTVHNKLYKVVPVKNGDKIVHTYTIDGKAVLNLVNKKDWPNGQDLTAMAVDIGFDIILNNFTAASLTANGKTIYNLSTFEDLVGVLGGENSKTKLMNQILGAVDANGDNGLRGLINDILAQLTNFEQLYKAFNNGEAFFTFDVKSGAWDIAVEHIYEEGKKDYITFDLAPNTAVPNEYTIALAIEVPSDNKYKAKIAAVLEELAKVLTVEAEITDLQKPGYSNKTISVGGAGKLKVTLNLSGNTDYNKVIALILAYADVTAPQTNLDRAKKLAEAMDCVQELNPLFEDVTVHEVFTALKDMSGEVNFKGMVQAVYDAVKDDNDNPEEATKAERHLSALLEETSTADELEAKWHVLLYAAGEALGRFDTSELDGTLPNGGNGNYSVNHTFTPSGIVAIPRTNYHVSYDVTEAYVELNLNLATKCTGLLGDVNGDGKVKFSDATLAARYAASKTDDIHVCVADVNGDGKVKFSDATLIARYAKYKIEKFPIEE